MYFREMINNIGSNIKDIQKSKKKMPKAKPEYDRITNDLNQGVSYKKNKDSRLNKIQNNTVMEGFYSEYGNKRLKKLSKKEQKELEAKRNRYQQELGNYSTAYTNFMNDYFTHNEKLKSCKVTCRNNYKAAGDLKKKNACLAGCDLKGPYITDCKDTYDGKKSNPSKKCKDVVGDKCAGGKILVGSEGLEILNNVNNKDSQGLGPVQGCCSCGGGSGGKPKGKFGNTTVISCSDITDANKTLQNQLQSICLSSDVGNNPMYLKNKYKSLQNSNTKLNNITNGIFKEYKELRNQRIKHNKNIQTVENKIGDDINKYSELNSEYEDMVKNSTNDLLTLDGQIEDSELNMNSESLKYTIWIGIATLFLLITLKKMNE